MQRKYKKGSVKSIDFYAAMVKEFIAYVYNTGRDTIVQEDLPTVVATEEHDPVHVSM